MTDRKSRLSAHWQSTVVQHLEHSAQVYTRLAHTWSYAILTVADVLTDSLQNGGKILLCGNGGSAADCQHMATELMSRLSKDFDRPALPAIALTTDTSFVTAFANDCGFEGVFARQVQGLGKPSDALIAISTSGRSPNVIRAVEQARMIGMHTVGLLGGDGGELVNAVDSSIVIPDNNTQRIQEGMLAVEHMLCYLIERYLFSEENST